MCGNAKEGRANHKCWASVLCSAVLVTTGETPEGVGDVAHELQPDEVQSCACWFSVRC